MAVFELTDIKPFFRQMLFQDLERSPCRLYGRMILIKFPVHYYRKFPINVTVTAGLFISQCPALGT